MSAVPVQEEQPGLVSIIIPCYNAEEYVGEAIESALNQTYEPREVVVIDDGSMDGSLNVIRSFGGKITWRTGENRGACHARNRGAELSSGDFLMFLDADDKMVPDTLNSLVQAQRGWQNADVVSACPWMHLRRKSDEWAAEPPDISFEPPKDDPIYGWLSGWYIPPCAILWSRTAYAKTEGWDEQLAANQDGDLMLQALIRGISLVTTNDGLALYRDYEVTDASVSTTVSKKTLFSRFRALRKAEAELNSRDMLSEYAIVLGQSYHNLARLSAGVNEGIMHECQHEATRLAGRQAITGSLVHRVLCKLLGLKRKEKLSRKLAGLWAWVGATNKFRSSFNAVVS